MSPVSGRPRVRFAPSPTGRLHVGGARTALFNWLYARRHGGTMILRSEDTDLERSRRDWEANLLQDLRWLGLDWDEGPDVGGPHAPYRQSERTALYASRVEQLRPSGQVYRCFCSDAELAAKREAQVAAGLEPRYDGTCRALPEDETERRAARCEPHALRFRVPAVTVRYPDRVRGDMQVEAETVGDFVLLRSNGLPTYNFACVVDDAAMHITHVIRGEDHLSNTMRQVLLYRALGLELPEFAHVSLILGADRTKLRKREGETGTYVDEYRDGGYLPEAVANFLALLGWSSPSGDEVLPPERLRAEFDLDRVSRSPAVFDVQKLNWLAGEHLRAAAVERLANLALPFLAAAGLPAGEEQVRRWIVAYRDGLAALGQLPERVRELLEPGDPAPGAMAALQTPEARRLLADLDMRLGRLVGEGGAELDGAGFKALLVECGRGLGLKGRDVFKPARAALSGRVHGPELPLLFDALGSERALQRIHAAARS